jgi:hypothetical protein
MASQPFPGFAAGRNCHPTGGSYLSALSARVRPLAPHREGCLVWCSRVRRSPHLIDLGYGFSWAAMARMLISGCRPIALLSAIADS